jgi:hypothetical protein
MTETAPDYVMGHNDRERRRLALQAAVLNPLTDSDGLAVFVILGGRFVRVAVGLAREPNDF